MFPYFFYFEDFFRVRLLYGKPVDLPIINVRLFMNLWKPQKIIRLKLQNAGHAKLEG